MRTVFTLARVIMAICGIHAAHGAEPTKIDGRAVCEHWDSYKPSPHNIITAPNVYIDCNVLSKIDPVYTHFETVDRLAWWQDHALHRVILPDEEKYER